MVVVVISDNPIYQIRFPAGERGVLGVTCREGVTGRNADGGAGARRGAPNAGPASESSDATPRREAAAFSFKIAISSSETPGRVTFSCLKLKGAEICSDRRLGVWTLDLRPINRCSLEAKPLRLRQPSMIMAM